MSGSGNEKNKFLDPPQPATAPASGVFWSALAGEFHPDPFVAAREHMVETQLRARGIRDQRILDAMATIPRHEFVDAEYRDQAYEDHPLPIDAGQTISQPYIVALMLDLLQLQAASRVLEIGTGSGYQTALLAELVRQVYSVERHRTLAQAAARRFSECLAYTNVSLTVGDGSRGWVEHAPFDVIVVSAAAPQIPPALLEQLREGGTHGDPSGSIGSARVDNWCASREGEAVVTNLEGCRFVPLIWARGASAKRW